MKGTEKQVRWAEDIRQRKLSELAGLVQRGELSPERLAAAREAEASARWWIDHRYQAAVVLVGGLLGEAPQMVTWACGHQTPATPRMIRRGRLTSPGQCPNCLMDAQHDAERRAEEIERAWQRERAAELRMGC